MVREDKTLDTGKNSELKAVAFFQEAEKADNWGQTRSEPGVQENGCWDVVHIKEQSGNWVSLGLHDCG